MALTDIMSRINHDAQKQAQTIIAEAEAQAKERLAQCKKELQKKAKLTQEKRAKDLESYVLQQTQIYGFASDQKILMTKREALAQLIQTVLAEILADQTLRQSTYAYALQKLPKNIERITVAQEDVAIVTNIVQRLHCTATVTAGIDVIGACFAYQGKARIDCSIPLIVTDIAQANEGRLAQELFSA